jgi:hypothetical protein
MVDVVRLMNDVMEKHEADRLALAEKEFDCLFSKVNAI